MKTVDFAWCCDDTYAPHMGAALCSALHNLDKGTSATVFVVGNLHDRNKKNIRAIINKYHAKVRFIAVDIHAFTDLKLTDYISPAAYFRLALPELLPQDVSKVLYLDCDLIIKDDLTKLFDIDIADYYFAAVPEAEQKSKYIDRERLGITQDALYFNTGVLLINLEKWRIGGSTRKIMDFIKANPHRIRWWDQDAMNIFFHDSYRAIDSYWNFSKTHVRQAGIQSGQEKTLPIGIIHFYGGSGDKPWDYFCVHPLQYEYDRYLKMTPWGGLSLKRIKRGIKKRLRRAINNPTVWKFLSATVLRVAQYIEIEKKFLMTIANYQVPSVTVACNPLKDALEWLARKPSLAIVQIGAYRGDEHNNPVSVFLKTNLAAAAVDQSRDIKVVLVEPDKKHFNLVCQNYAGLFGVRCENVAIARKAEANGITLEDLLKRHQIQHLDLLQIDAASLDYEILKSIDFDAIRPTFIHYKRVFLHDKEDDCRRFMEHAGYVLMDWGQDAFCIKINF
jgi:lipopolysaccharide biosynthesis glycosyltransferase